MPNGEFDIFGENWGVGIPAEWFDFSTITALIEAKSKDGSNPGYLWNFAVRETRIVAANLPRGS